MIFRRIALGLSGGVDSAVSAHLLKQKGFEVIGIYVSDKFPENSFNFTIS